MTAALIDGTAIAAKVRAQVAEEARALMEKTGQKPGLATVLVGENPASQAYVKSKRKACAELGMESFGHELPATATQEEVEGLVARLNAGGAAAALEILDDLERDVVLMRVLGGLDATAVGEAIGKRPGHVRVIQFRAMAKLREDLLRRGYGGTEETV